MESVRYKGGTWVRRVGSDNLQVSACVCACRWRGSCDVKRSRYTRGCQSRKTNLSCNLIKALKSLYVGSAMGRGGGFRSQGGEGKRK